MKKVIMDTDFLLQSLRWKVYVQDELERLLDYPYVLCILDKTLDELTGKQDAQLARTFASQLTVLPTTRDKPVDDLLLAYASKESILVATQDKKLKEKLKKRNISIITIRNKSHLELV